jgi:hypothetical protein
MKKYLLFILYNLFSSSIFSQNVEFEKAYKFLITNIYNDTTIQKTGNILAYPGEIKSNDKPNIIYIKSGNKLSNINSILSSEKNSKMLYDIEPNIYESIDNVNLILLNEKIIDTTLNNSNEYNYNLLGHIVINNIYVRKNYKSDNFNEIFFEIISVSKRHTRFQSLDIIHMVKINGKWKIKETYNLEKS